VEIEGKAVGSEIYKAAGNIGNAVRSGEGKAVGSEVSNEMEDNLNLCNRFIPHRKHTVPPRFEEETNSPVMNRTAIQRPSRP
jgi:hypothetical protein